MEEEVHIVMPSNLTYELLASDHTDVKLEKNKVILSRIPPMSDISMILLAEGSIDGDTFIPSITSKTSKGKIVKKAEEILPNYGTILISFFTAILIFAFMLYAPKKYYEYQREQAKQVILNNYAYLQEDGWTGFEVFHQSGYQQSYGKNEFPLAFTGVKKIGEKTFELSFIATNKTTLPLMIDTYFDNDDEIIFSSLKGIKNAFSVSVNPLTSSPVVVSFTLDNDKKLSDIYIGFILKFSNNSLFGIQFYPEKNNKIKSLIKYDHS